MAFTYRSDGRVDWFQGRDGVRTILSYSENGELIEVDTGKGLVGTIDYFHDGMRAGRVKEILLGLVIAKEGI